MSSCSKRAMCHALERDSDTILMLHCRIDHIVITASSLADGEEYVRQTLGVAPQVGGEHQRMGTHNVLLRLGEEMYLEVVAVNPNGAQPRRPRWFEVDQHGASTTPGLATWVARTSDIQGSVLSASVPLGDIEPMNRGQFNWLITIPADGSLPLQGIAPVLIQWLSESHPATSLQDLGCSLVRLEGFHTEAERIVRMLQSIGFEGDFSVSPLSTQMQPYLVAHIRTPCGERQLRTSP